MKHGNIITPPEFDLHDFTLLLIAQSRLRFSRATEVILENTSESNFLSVIKNNSLFDVLESNIQEGITSEYVSWNFFATMFFEFSLFKILVAAIPNHIKVHIDNDHSSLIAREDFNSINNYEDYIAYND